MAGMELLEAYGLPAQSIVLAKEGCVDTVVDADAVLEIMDLGTEGQGAHGADASPERAGTAA
jgi:hypothetical protein